MARSKKRSTPPIRKKPPPEQKATPISVAVGIPSQPSPDLPLSSHIWCLAALAHGVVGVKELLRTLCVGKPHCRHICDVSLSAIRSGRVFVNVLFD